MDYSLSDLEIFIRVAELQSMTAVAAEKGLTPGTISKRLGALEDQFGARLFDRTTRAMHITPAGEILLADARAAVAILQDTPGKIQHNNALGPVVIAIPSPLLAQLDLKSISDALPGIKLRSIDPSPTTGVEEMLISGIDGHRVDIVVSLNQPQNSLGSIRGAGVGVSLPQVIVASPAYIEAHGYPATFNELNAHQILSSDRLNTSWALGSDEVTAIPLNAAHVMPHPTAIIYATKAGMGIALLPMLMVAKALDDGSLVQVLPDHGPASQSAVYYLAANGQAPERVKRVVDILAPILKQQSATAAAVLANRPPLARPDGSNATGGSHPT